MKKSTVENKIAVVLNNLDNVKMSNKLKAQAILVEVLAAGLVPSSVYFPSIDQYVENTVLLNVLAHSNIELRFEPETDLN